MVRARMGSTGTHSLDAWADLSATLRRYARGLTGSADAADDLAQQTLARLLTRSPDQPPHLGYAYAAMTRAWMDEQRSLRRRIARLRTIAAGLAPGRNSSGTLATAGERHDLRHTALARALDTLPTRRRAALVLRAIEGLRYEQIAAALGCSVATVRGELHEARKALRNAATTAAIARLEDLQ